MSANESHSEDCAVTLLGPWHEQDNVHIIDHKPTVAEMQTLESGHCFVFGQDVFVQAATIDESQIEIECPFCWSKWKKNGERTARSKRVKHYHGSLGGTLTVGAYEERSAHCAVDVRFWKMHDRGVSGCRVAPYNHEHEHLCPKYYTVVVTNETRRE